MTQGDPPGLAAVPAASDGPPVPEEAWPAVSPRHYAAAERLAQVVEDLLPDQNKQKRIELSSALLDFYKTR